jgi:hypothetical protein
MASRQAGKLENDQIAPKSSAKEVAAILFGPVLFPLAWLSESYAVWSGNRRGTAHMLPCHKHPRMYRCAVSPGAARGLAPCASFLSPHSCRWVRQSASSRYRLGSSFSQNHHTRPQPLPPATVLASYPSRPGKQLNTLYQSTPHAHHYHKRNSIHRIRSTSCQSINPRTTLASWVDRRSNFIKEHPNLIPRN